MITLTVSRLAVFALMLVATPITVAQEPPLSQPHQGDKTQVRATVLALHKVAVHDVIDGKSLDSFLPAETKKRFSGSLTLMWNESNEHVKNGGEAVVTYRQVIQWSEAKLAESENKITVTIVADPGGCLVKYKPVIGGPELDAGATRIVKHIEPRWYSFSCDCKTPALIQRVDCTTDTTVSFSCPASSGSAKPAEKH